MSRIVILSGFAVLMAAAAILEVRARFGSGHGERRATFADVLDTAIGHPAGRTIALLGWLWTGWHLFVR